ncbi:MAG: hypothetical protein DRO67_07095 [Candidatus Asgardarchaeum californiense]|nr:MAG: hypothetical protein DRO67_07095 [Candidatus Asgardarchaeum californiense]
MYQDNEQKKRQHEPLEYKTLLQRYFESKYPSPENDEKPLPMTLSDYVALFIAYLQTGALPLIMVMVLFFVLAVLIYWLFVL